MVPLLHSREELVHVYVYDLPLSHSVEPRNKKAISELAGEVELDVLEVFLRHGEHIA